MGKIFHLRRNKNYDYLRINLTRNDINVLTKQKETHRLRNEFMVAAGKG